MTLSTNKKPHFKGALKKKITLRVPSFSHLLADIFLRPTAEERLKREDTDFEKWVHDEGAATLRGKRFTKLVPLADFYNLLPPKGTKMNKEIVAGIMERLAMALAADFVPGFRFELKETKATGAPTKWTPARFTALLWDVERWQEKNPASSITEACEALAKRPRRQNKPWHGWQHYDAETLRRRHSEAKSGPVFTMLRHSESRMRERGLDPATALAEEMNEARPE